MKFQDLLNENISEAFVSDQSNLKTKEINVIAKKNGLTDIAFLDTHFKKATKDGSLYCGIWYDKEEEEYCVNCFTIVQYINKPGYEIELDPMPIKCFDSKSEAQKFVKSYKA